MEDEIEEAMKEGFIFQIYLGHKDLTDIDGLYTLCPEMLEDDLDINRHYLQQDIINIKEMLYYCRFYVIEVLKRLKTTLYEERIRKDEFIIEFDAKNTDDVYLELILTFNSIEEYLNSAIIIKELNALFIYMSQHILYTRIVKSIFNPIFNYNFDWDNDYILHLKLMNKLEEIAVIKDNDIPYVPNNDYYFKNNDIRKYLYYNIEVPKGNVYYGDINNNMDIDNIDNDNIDNDNMEVVPVVPSL